MLPSNQLDCKKKFPSSKLFIKFAIFTEKPAISGKPVNTTKLASHKSTAADRNTTNYNTLNQKLTSLRSTSSEKVVETSSESQRGGG